MATLDEVMEELAGQCGERSWREHYQRWSHAELGDDDEGDVQVYWYGESFGIGCDMYAAAALMPREEAEELCRRLDKIAANARRVLAARGDEA